MITNRTGSCVSDDQRSPSCLQSRWPVIPGSQPPLGPSLHPQPSQSGQGPSKTPPRYSMFSLKWFHIQALKGASTNTLTSKPDLHVVCLEMSQKQTNTTVIFALLTQVCVSDVCVCVHPYLLCLSPHHPMTRSSKRRPRNTLPRRSQPVANPQRSPPRLTLQRKTPLSQLHQNRQRLRCQ